MHARLLRSWAEGLDAVWAAPDPASVLAAMGTQAGDLFTRSAQLRAFLEAQQPGSTVIPQAARIKPVTIHPDGTVTLGGASCGRPGCFSRSGRACPCRRRKTDVGPPFSFQFPPLSEPMIPIGPFRLRAELWTPVCA